MDEESLFTLDLAVTKIDFLSSFECKFPLIAFKLLDFPNIFLNTNVDNADPSLKLSEPIDEVVSPSFDTKSIRKGKSCLFKANHELLMKLLSSTPLYILLMDNENSASRLMGAAMISLEFTMKNICEDIIQQGLSNFSTHGQNGTYPFHDLMGHKIGSIDIAFRLVSLGRGLLSHLPEENIHRVGPNSNANVCVQKNAISLDKTIQTSDLAHVVSESSQTERFIYESTGIQTIGKKIPTKIRNNNYVAELPISNGLCPIDPTQPPPLYYNSDAQSSFRLCRSSNTKRDNSKHYTFFDEDNNSNYDYSIDKLSDNDTIRTEDISKQSIIDDNDSIYTNQMIHEIDSKDELNNIEDIFDYSTHSVRSTLREFPLLDALLKELIAIKSKSRVSRKKSPIRKDAKSTSMHASSRSIQNEKSSVGNFKEENSIDDNVKKVMNKDPKRKGHSNFKNVYHGITKAHRLNLERTNPDLLEKILLMEEKILEKRKETTRKRYGKKFFKEPIPERLAKGDATIDKSQIENKETINFRNDDNLDSSTSPSKRPKPTPRLSIDVNRFSSLEEKEFGNILNLKTSSIIDSHKLVDSVVLSEIRTNYNHQIEKLKPNDVLLSHNLSINALNDGLKLNEGEQNKKSDDGDELTSSVSPSRSDQKSNASISLRKLNGNFLDSSLLNPHKSISSPLMASKVFNTQKLDITQVLYGKSENPVSIKNSNESSFHEEGSVQSTNHSYSSDESSSPPSKTHQSHNEEIISKMSKSTSSSSHEGYSDNFESDFDNSLLYQDIQKVPVSKQNLGYTWA